MPSTLSKFKARALALPDVKNAYDELAEEFALMDEIFKVRAASSNSATLSSPCLARRRVCKIESGN